MSCRGSDHAATRRGSECASGQFTRPGAIGRFVRFEDRGFVAGDCVCAHLFSLGA
jgi:hypothetical protein